MKTIAILALTAAAFVSCQQQQPTPTAPQEPVTVAPIKKYGHREVKSSKNHSCVSDSGRTRFFVSQSVVYSVTHGANAH